MTAEETVEGELTPIGLSRDADSATSRILDLFARLFDVLAKAFGRAARGAGQQKCENSGGQGEKTEWVLGFAGGVENQDRIHGSDSIAWNAPIHLKPCNDLGIKNLMVTIGFQIRMP